MGAQRKVTGRPRTKTGRLPLMNNHIVKIPAMKRWLMRAQLKANQLRMITARTQMKVTRIKSSRTAFRIATSA